MKKKHNTPPDSVDSRRTGQRIRALMAARGLSVRDVQNYLGLSCPQGIYRWLRGDTLPSVDNHYAMQRLLDASAGHILCGSYMVRSPEEMWTTAIYQRTASSYVAALQTARNLCCSRIGF